MILRGLITLEKPGREAIVSKAIVNVDEYTHIARLASEIPIDKFNGTIRISFGFMLEQHLPVFIPSIPFECISLYDTDTVCFEADCDELYEYSLGEETSNNYKRIHSEICRRGGSYKREDASCR